MVRGGDAGAEETVAYVTEVAAEGGEGEEGGAARGRQEGEADAGGEGRRGATDATMDVSEKELSPNGPRTGCNGGPGRMNSRWTTEVFVQTSERWHGGWEI